MGKPAARIGDMHVCPAVNPGPVPHVGGPVAVGSPNVLTGSIPQARVGDMCICTGPPDTIASGSSGVLVNGMPAARMTDSTVHGGKIVVGMPTVLIGDGGGGGGGGGAGGGAITTSVVAGTNVGVTSLLSGGQAEKGKSKASPTSAKVPTTYGSAIEIKGSEEFRKKTIAALDDIKKTPTGKKLLESLDSSGKKVTIEETGGGNGASPKSGAKATRKPDGSPGEGTDSVVKFNPDKTQIGDGSKDWHTRPAGVGLAHELIHANHSAHGTNDFSIVGEQMAVGEPPPHDKQEFTENKIRAEWNPKQPKRPQY